MFREIFGDAFRLNWAESRARAAFPCILAIALSLGAGLIAGRPIYGMIAAGGAMSVGFGAFQTLGNSRRRPMLWASLGMSLATGVGSLVPHTPLGVALNGLAVGFVYGMLSALGESVAWIALQCAIFALVSTAYPSDLANASGRALLVLLGGCLQMAIVLLFRRIHARFDVVIPSAIPFPGFASALELLQQKIRARSAEFRYAVKLALLLAGAAALARALALPNGYWVPMTALFVLRTDLRETYSRGVARVAGTLVGAGLATVLASGLRPDPVALSALIVLSAWLCYSVLNVNYGVFSICVTAYIAFLLSFAGLPEGEVALHRVANTALGGLLALLVATPEFFSRRQLAG